jgi:endonuclease YncB( thermonuclease family)
MGLTISHTTRRLVSIALAAGVFAAGGMAETPCTTGLGGTIAGPAVVVDGDTLAIASQRVRLEGIDAPEAGQTCGTAAAGSWRCGTEASGALARFIQGKDVRCEPRGLDKYGRTLGVCCLGDQDINAWMVRQGYAWAFVKYSARYVREEAQARAERLGIWQGEAMPAWDYRAQRWAGAEPQAPNGCAIKGNVTANGKIYHMPWSPWYAQIKMDPERGRRWFCSEAEAMAAGWRPVNVN